MALPSLRQQEILDVDYGLLQALVGEMPGAVYNIGLATLTRDPVNLDSLEPVHTPWLLQTDGDGSGDYKPSSVVAEEFDEIFLGYVLRDNQRFPGKSAPELRRMMMADVLSILDTAEHRGTDANGHALVNNWGRTWQVYDDPNGEWAMFVVTERLSYTRRTF